MQVRILGLDTGLSRQKELFRRYRPVVHDLQEWGATIRLACRFQQFRRFEQELTTLWNSSAERAPQIVFYGSGDFHHVSLALLQRLQTPCNLLIFDNHPDWMRGIPFLHCGTWVYHAVQLPWVERVFIVGGDVDFDNAFRWLAPWSMLRSGKITVFPGVRCFERGSWKQIRNEPVRGASQAVFSTERWQEILHPYRDELGRRPLYVSIDKDVLIPTEAVVNWDSGHLRLTEVKAILHSFLQAAQGRLAGADILGDWSPVRLRGWMRRMLHLTEHPALAVDPIEATHVNERANLALLETIEAAQDNLDNSDKDMAKNSRSVQC